VLWNAHDENDDELHFSVYFAAENETDWKLWKDKLEQKFYSWDSTAMPDGAYYLKIVATDAASNSPGLALTTERESERFVGRQHATCSRRTEGRDRRRAEELSPSVVVARDATSSIERAQI